MVRAVPLVVFAFIAAVALAADHPIEGDRLVMRDPAKVTRRSVRFSAVRDVAIDPTAAADPRSAGATLEIAGENVGDGTSGPIALDAAFWSGLGRPAGSKGYKWQNPAAPNGVKKIMFKTGKKGGTLLLSGNGAGWPYAITKPQGVISVRLTIGSDVYCAEMTAFVANAPGKVTVARSAPPASCVPPVCGDGTVGGREECDDGNTDAGDGCSSTCELENASALCAGVPAVAGTSLTAVRVASGLASPVHVTAPRLDPNRLFIVEQPGRIRILKNGVLLPKPFLAIEKKVKCCDEQGLLSVAFHPDYEANGRFFVFYVDDASQLTIARYEVSATDPDRADPASEKVLLTIDHSQASNHNGGLIEFGPDGFLYAGTGDGGGGGDPFENGQSLSSLLGKQLRIDVDVNTPPYHAMPGGNPFPAAGDPLNLIWAYGLRNPWRFSFDRATGELYTADVGQDSWEEIDVQPAGTGGLDYGWDVFEGRHCFEPDPDPTCPDPPTGFTMPVLEYDHGQGCSIIGGFVYRGCRMPDLRGTYFYADFCSAFVRTFEGVSGGDAQHLADRTADLEPPGAPSISAPTSFGEDARGELYVTDHDGEVFEIVPGS